MYRELCSVARQETGGKNQECSFLNLKLELEFSNRFLHRHAELVSASHKKWIPHQVRNDKLVHLRAKDQDPRVLLLNLVLDT